MARHRAAHESGVPSDAESSDTGTDETNDATATDGADDSDAKSDATGTDGDADADGADEDDDVAVERTADADAFWADVRVDPIEIALPGGVGYTLRAYRAPADLTPVEGDEPEVDEDDGVAAALDPDTRTADAVGDAEDSDAVADDTDEDADDRDADSDEDDDESDETDADESDEDDEDEEPEEPEEVPVFLSRRGKLLMFHEPEDLVGFLRSGEQHALSNLDTIDDLVERIEAGFIAPTDEDQYELDLLVNNLRRGHDVWEPELIISAGELARDLGYALRLNSVLTALSPGSPLDDLDEATRAATAGGFGGFRARRRMRKIAPQQASLAWRTIIGKIRAAVDWRE
ncbi:MAG: DNA primase [Actinocatenispora sp.]